MIIPFTFLQIASLVFTLLGILVGFTALSTPAWQVVYAREIEQWIQSGLWLNCQTRPSGMYTCTYTFSSGDFEFYTSAELLNLRTPPFYAWQRTLLAIFLGGEFLAFMALVSLFLSFHQPTRKLSAVGYVLATGVSVILHTGALVSFALLSQMVEYRFFHVSVSGIYEKHRGYSFYLMVLATVLLLISLFLSIGHFIRIQGDGAGKNSNHQQSQRMMNYGDEPYAPSSSTSHHQQGSILDPYESQFAMRDLPDIPSSYHSYG